MSSGVNNQVEPAFWVLQSEFTQICYTVVIVQLFATPTTNKALKGGVKLAAWMIAFQFIRSTFIARTGCFLGVVTHAYRIALSTSHYRHEDSPSIIVTKFYMIDEKDQSCSTIKLEKKLFFI